MSCDLLDDVMLSFWPDRIAEHGGTPVILVEVEKLLSIDPHHFATTVCIGERTKRRYLQRGTLAKAKIAQFKRVDQLAVNL